MKFTIGTASSSMEFKEDIQLIKSSLLYADEIELIGMAEYAMFKYLPNCFLNSKDIEALLNNLIDLLATFDNPEARKLVDEFNEIKDNIKPYIPYLKKKKYRSKDEIIFQTKFKGVEDNCKRMLQESIIDLRKSGSIGEIQKLIDRKIVSIYDYSYTGFSVDELTGGYFANLLSVIKHGGTYPLFDSISADAVGTVLDSKIVDFSKTDKEIIRHAGVANNILMTLPTLESATIDEIVSFKKELKVPLDNFRTAIYSFSEKIESMPWDEDFKYECIKLYDTEVIPKVNEINELSSETSVLRNFGSKVFADEDERRKVGYVGAGLITAITKGEDIISALGVLESFIRTGAQLGISAVGISAFMKTISLLNQAHQEVKEKKSEICGNVMYYYHKAQKRFS